MTDAERYFSMDPKRGEAATGGAYVEVDKDVSAVEFVPGLVFRPVVGDQLMANFVRYDPNTVAPLHTHEEEQITVVIEGELEFDLAGDLRNMRPGMAVPRDRHLPPAPAGPPRVDPGLQRAPW